MKTPIVRFVFAVALLALTGSPVGAAAAAASGPLTAGAFATLCNTQGQDFDHPAQLVGNVNVVGGSGSITGCNVRIAAGARLRFVNVTLSGCGFSFNIFGGDRSSLDIVQSTISMGDQNYFLFDSADDIRTQVIGSTLAQCGPNEFADVVVTASLGTGGHTTVIQSRLIAPTSGGTDPNFGHVVIFAPSGPVIAVGNVLAGAEVRIGTYAGGKCRSIANVPNVACQDF